VLRVLVSQLRTTPRPFGVVVGNSLSIHPRVSNASGDGCKLMGWPVCTWCLRLCDGTLSHELFCCLRRVGWAGRVTGVIDEDGPPGGNEEGPRGPRAEGPTLPSTSGPTSVCQAGCFAVVVFIIILQAPFSTPDGLFGSRNTYTCTYQDSGCRACSVNLSRDSRARLSIWGSLHLAVLPLFLSWKGGRLTC
jgi:hypothetical protein